MGDLDTWRDAAILGAFILIVVVSAAVVGIVGARAERKRLTSKAGC